jgi:hypothetical protein
LILDMSYTVLPPLGKMVATGENLVDCDIWVENQDGVKVAPGSATIALPSREG